MRGRLRVLLGSSVVFFGAGVVAWSCGGSESGNDGGSDVTAQDNVAPDTGTKDSASDATSNDASDGSTGPRCTTSKPFGAIALVAELGAADAGSSGARLTNDSLTVYYATATGGVNGALEVATRDAAASTFGASTPLLSGDAGMLGLDPSVSPDGLTLYAQFNPSNFVEVRYATRVSTATTFSPLTGVAGLSGSAPNHGAPFLRGDNSQLWYAARVAPDGGPTQGSSSLDIFVGTVTGAGQATPLVAETEINSTADETSPAITPDGLTIFFARKVAVDGGVSSTFHIYSSTRGVATDPFPTPVIVPELDDMPLTNTQPTWISPDRCVIYLQSDRGGSAGAIYSATRPL